MSRSVVIGRNWGRELRQYSQYLYRELNSPSSPAKAATFYTLIALALALLFYFMSSRRTRPSAHAPPPEIPPPTPLGSPVTTPEGILKTLTSVPRPIILFCIETVSLDHEILSLLVTISKSCELYLLSFIPGGSKDDQEKYTEEFKGLAPPQLFEGSFRSHVTQLLEATFTDSLQRLLFCSSSDGKVSIARMIEPTLFVDSCLETVNNASKFVYSAVHLGTISLQTISELFANL